MSIVPVVFILAALEVPFLRRGLTDVMAQSWLFLPALALTVWATVFHTAVLLRIVGRFNEKRFYGVLSWIDKLQLGQGALRAAAKASIGNAGANGHPDRYRMDIEEFRAAYKGHVTNAGTAILIVWMVQGAAVVLCVATICALSVLHDPCTFPALWENGVTGVEAVYFAVVTLATLGYGDIFPGNSFGQVIVIGCGAITIAFVTFGAAIVMSSFVALKEQFRREVMAFYE